MTPIPAAAGPLSRTARILSRAARIAAAVVTVAALLLVAPPAHACSCTPPPPVAEVLDTAPLAFVGAQVDRVEARPNDVVLTVSVAEVYVGEATTLVDLHTGSGDADCGIDLAGAGPVGFTPSLRDGGLYVGLCGGTVPADEMRQVFAARDVAATRPVSTPDATPADDADPDDIPPEGTTAGEPPPRDLPSVEPPVASPNDLPADSLADTPESGGDLGGTADDNAADDGDDGADPQTGPSSLVWLLAVVAAGGAVGAGYVMVRRRR